MHLSRVTLWISLFLLAGTTIFTTSSCDRDNRTALFRLDYPNFQFTIPPGLNPTLPRAFVVNDVPTRIMTYTMDTGIDTSQYREIRPISARLESLNGFDFDFVQAISIRVCPEGPGDCDQLDEVFFAEDLAFRRFEVIDLFPSLLNAYDALTAQRFQLDVVFAFATVTPVALDCKLDLAFEAVE